MLALSLLFHWRRILLVIESNHDTLTFLSVLFSGLTLAKDHLNSCDSSEIKISLCVTNFPFLVSCSLKLRPFARLLSRTFSE